MHLKLISNVQFTKAKLVRGHGYSILRTYSISNCCNSGDQKPIRKRGETEKPYEQENLIQIKMKKYLIKATYNANGVKGLIEDGGTQRKLVVQKMLAGMGGKLESFYYAFGEHDAYITAELPDDVSAAAVGLRVNSTGLVSISTTVLLSPEDIDAASKKSISYKAPGEK